MRDFPQITTEQRCLSCKACCRFDDKKSIWRPRVATCEEIFSQEQDSIDSSGYIHAETHTHCISCVFLNICDNRCSVYALRPLECRMYPFLLFWSEGQIAVGVHLSCPYVQEEENSHFFKEKTQDVRDFCSAGEFMAFVQAHREMVSDYSQYMNEIKILFTVPL